MPCRSCGIDTLHVGTAPRCHECYMVQDLLWARATRGRTRSFLCIGCLEQRIGRELTAADFTDVPINQPRHVDTPRLAARKATHGSPR